MARSFRRGGFGARGRARRTRPRWTAVLVADTGTAGTPDYIELVAPSDYATAAALEDSATFLRLRGNLQLYNTSTTLAATVSAVIYAQDESNAALPPDVQANYQQGNILWAKTIVLAPATAATAGAMSFTFHDIDIKAKRKLEEPQNSIWLGLISATGGGDVAFGGLFRSLLRLNA